MIVRWEGQVVSLRPQWGDDPADVALVMIALNAGSPLPGTRYRLVSNVLMPWTGRIARRAAELFGGGG